jgi:ABC-type nitrate/sulfonate/bicarbonate transport system permease component
MSAKEIANLAAPVSAPSEDTARRRRRISFFHRRAFGWTALALVLLGWEYLARVASSPGLPAPSRIFAAWRAEVTDGDLLTALESTLVSMLYGYSIALVAGTVIGILMARVRVIYALLEPLVELVRPTPTIIFVPVIILYVGIGRPMNVIAIVIAAIEPVLINAFFGARSVPEGLRDMAATFRLSWWQTLYEVVIPAAAPQMFVGFRLALAVSLVIAIASGMIAGNAGIGYYILIAQQTLDIPKMFAGAATVAVVGYGLNTLFLLLERKVLHWHSAHRKYRGT